MLLLDLLRPLILNSPFFHRLVLCPLLCPLLCLFLHPFLCLLLYLPLFLVLDPLLFCRLVMCPLLFLISDPPLFCSHVMLLFFVTKFQLCCCRFLVCWVYLFFLDLHLLEHSNSPCHISLGSACQPALQSPFVHS